MTKQNRLDKIITRLFIGISLLGAVITIVIMYNKSQEAVVSFSSEEQRLLDSISILQKEIDASHIRQNKLQHGYDSMLNVEPIIINQTREKIKFIYTEATPSELDSIIRTKSKRKRRYS
jgi:hypothetical protein